MQLSLLDRLDIVAPATLAGFAEVGWSAQVQVADVLAWAASTHDAAPGTAAPRWDLITTSLFLHHFEGGELDLLLAAAASRCDRFFACEPSRSWLALAGSHLVGAIGANAVTREDAVLSVHAGFRRDELSARWPQAGGPWQMREIRRRPVQPLLQRAAQRGRSMTAATRTTFDALIVGAGLAGSAAAIQLARAGWSVALIERQRFPRRKVCGECMAASNLPLLQALGVGDAFHARAGPELRRVTLWHGDSAVTADLPPADHDRYRLGPGPRPRHAGRPAAGTGPCRRRRRCSSPGPCRPSWARPAPGIASFARSSPPRCCDCARRSSSMRTDRGKTCPSDRPRRRLARSAADLFAFKANFTRSSLPEGAISVLALDGGYGGMVVADGGTTTVACCIRRDRLSALRVRGARPARGRCRRGLAAA